LFGLYSGENCFVEYPNGDNAFSVQIIFKTINFSGNLKQIGTESKEHRFFKNTKIPINLNPRQRPFILDWVNDSSQPIIK